MDLENILKWIEAHPTSIDLVTWATLIFIGWLTGIFSFFRKYKQKPFAQITVASKILSIPCTQLGQDSIKTTFVIYLSINNPTDTFIHADDFYLSYRTKRCLKKFSKFHQRISIPSRPRRQIGDNVRLSRVFFTDFQDGTERYTEDGRVEPKHSQSGFLFFVSNVWGNYEPKIKNNKLEVKLKITLGDGRTIKCHGKVAVSTEIDTFESWMPGFTNHINDSRTWNTFIE